MQTRGRHPTTLDYHRINPLRFHFKLILLACWLALAGSGTILCTNAYQIACQVALGLALAHQTELIHELLHQLGTGRGRVDRLIGRLFGVPVGVSFWFYRYWHLWHHAHVGKPDDHESFGYAYQLLRSRSRLHRLVGFVLHLSMASHFAETGRRILLAVLCQLAPALLRSTPRMPAATARNIQVDYQLMALWLVALAMVSWHYGSSLIVGMCVIPLIVWAPIHSLIELPEHFGCDSPEASVCKNTRSIKTNAFLAWFVNGNCYHLGHHFDMRVPIGQLGAFEAHVRAKHPFKHEEISYSAFFRRFLSHLWTGTGFAFSNQ